MPYSRAVGAMREGLLWSTMTCFCGFPLIKENDVLRRTDRITTIGSSSSTSWAPCRRPRPTAWTNSASPTMISHARLSSIENGLVDAYVRGELAGADSERFRSHYLSSPVRREKVRFAEALASAADRTAAVSSLPVQAKRRGWLRPVPLLSAAACLLLLAVGVVLYQNGKLQNQIGRIRQESDALQARERSLQQEIDSRRAAPATPVEKPQAIPLSHSAVALVLMPQTRSIDPPATLAVASDADTVSLQLQLEDESFPAYRVTLKDPASDRSLWRSDPLPPDSGHNQGGPGQPSSCGAHITCLQPGTYGRPRRRRRVSRRVCPAGCPVAAVLFIFQQGD